MTKFVKKYSPRCLGNEPEICLAVGDKNNCLFQKGRYQPWFYQKPKLLKYTIIQSIFVILKQIMPETSMHVTQTKEIYF